MADQDQTTPTYTEEQMAAFEKYEKDLEAYNKEAKTFKENKESAYDLYPAIGSAIGAGVPLAGAATSGIANLGSKAIDAMSNRPSAGERWGEAVGGPGGKTVDEAVRNREIAKSIKPGEIVTKEGVIIPESAAPKAAPKVAPKVAKEAFMNPEELNFLRRTGLLRKVLAGAGTGFDIGDAYKRYQQGDPTGAIISGLGALGYPVSKIPHPIATGVGYGMMFGAPALNEYRDTHKPVEKASGGLTYLKKPISHFAKGGEAGVVADALGAISDAIQEAKAIKAGEKAASQFTPRPTVDMKLSEALSPHEGKKLILTQSDNYGVHGGRRGGNQFSNFQNIEPLAQAEDIVWMNDTPQHANSLIKLGGENTIVAPYIGKQDQLKSNRSVWGDVMDAHYNREKYLKPEQFDLINNKIATMKDSKGRLVFPQPFDIRDKFATQELGGDTFARRGVLSSMLGEGEGVGKTKNGIALPTYQEILQANRDPLTIGQPTTSVGSRLFTVDPSRASQYDTRFNPNYNWTVYGKDLGVNVGFTPPEHAIAKYWNDYIKRTGKVPSGNGMFGYNKNAQDITHDYLMNLEKEGYAKGGEVGVGLEALAQIKAAIQEAKAAAPAVNRIDMNFKDVTKRIPELQEGIAKLNAGQISKADYADLVNKYKPVTPFAFIPKPATAEEAIGALKENQKGLFGVPSQILQEGHPVGLRLDIPAYTKKGVWVPTVHEQKSGFGAGTLIGHESVAHVTDPTFGMSQEAAAAIAGGKPKGTIATIKGNWKPTTPDEAVSRSQKIMNDPAWIQVGMDPERHAHFYDRSTMDPVVAGKEAIQVGPAVFVKNPVYGKKEDFKYAEGGEVEPAALGLKDFPPAEPLPTLSDFIPDMSTIKAIPKAASIIGNKLLGQGQKEKSNFGWRAVPDIALNIGSGLVGSVSDLANAFVPSLNENEFGPDKPNFLGSKHLHDVLREKGITKNDFPLIETGLLLGGPALAKRAPGLINKAADLTKGLPVGMSIKDVSPRFTSNKVQFTSPLEDALNVFPKRIESMPGEQWSGWLRNQPANVKKEAEAIDLQDKLASKTNVSKNDLLEHVKSESPRVSRRVLNNDLWVERHPEGDFYVTDNTGDIMGERFHDYNDAIRSSHKLGAQFGTEALTLPEGDRDYREILLSSPWHKSPSGLDFSQAHFPDTKNLLAHLRVNHRTSAEGKPALFLEEVQSDWGQKGRKLGFDKEPLPTNVSPEELVSQHYHKLDPDQKRWMNDFNNEMEMVLSNKDHPGQESAYENLMDKYSRWINTQSTKNIVPSGPYVGDTKDWSSLALKHAIKDAIENKKEQVAWTTGDQQNFRNMKEAAPKGMKDFYDKIMHQSANDILKKLGAKERVRPIEFDLKDQLPPQAFGDRPEYFDPNEIIPAHRSKQWGFDITPEMKEKILKEGLPKFKEGHGVIDTDPNRGGLSATNYPNPYGLRSWQDESGEYHGQMMPKTSGWQGEIPTLTGDVMTEQSLGGNTPDEPFYPMITQHMTPDMISRAKDFEAGLVDVNHPEVQDLLKHAREEAKRLMDQGKSPFKDYN